MLAILSPYLVHDFVKALGYLPRVAVHTVADTHLCAVFLGVLEDWRNQVCVDNQTFTDTPLGGVS
jgi:hypothetical protein